MEVKINVDKSLVITQEAAFQSIFGMSTDSFIDSLKTDQKYEGMIKEKTA